MKKEKKKVLIISCIVIVALSSIVLANQWMNVSNNNTKNFTIKFNSKLGSEFNKVVETALADPEVREKVEFLERKYGEVTPEVEVCNDNRCIIRFNLEVDKNKAERTERELIFFSHRPHGFSCIVNMETRKVEEILGWHFEEAMLLDTILAKPGARSKLETLKEKYGKVSIVYVISSDKPNIVEARFTPEFNPHEERTEELYGILCVVDKEAKKVVKVEEFDIPPISVPTPPPLNPPFWELRLYLNNDTKEFVHEFVQGEEFRIFLENIGNETITIPNPAPWEVKVLPMIDAEIESKLHCRPEETVYAKFPRIYPDMYNITNGLIYKPKVKQTAILIHPNETLTWTWDQRLEDGSLLKPGLYQVVLRGLDVKCVEQTIFYVLPEQ